MTTTIGIVSSIPYEKSFQDALENNVPNVEFQTPDDDNGDVASDLALAVQNFAGNVTYIVTLGGVNSYNAAAGTKINPSTPFLSLIGETPSSIPTNCYGGVSLESWTYNKERVQHIIDKGYNSEGAISLYYNQNSGMSTHEVDDWVKNLYANASFMTPQGKHILVKTPVKAMKADGTNDAKDFATTVKYLASPAVIVSAAPFLHKGQNKLVHALNNHKVSGSNIYACYPVWNYMHAKPQKGSATVYTQKIEEGITTLASIINAAIKSGKQGFKQQAIGTPQDI